MKEHLTIEQLKAYGERELSEAAMSAAILHLHDCRACFDRYRELFSAENAPLREISLTLWAADDFEEPFHLDYEEYLRPLADGELDAVNREIVDSHLRVCSECARAVRDLQEFRDGLLLHQIMRNKNQPARHLVFTRLWHRLTDENARRLTIAFTMLTLAVGGIYLLLEDRRRSSIGDGIAASEPPAETKSAISVDEASPVLQPEQPGANGDENPVHDSKNAAVENSAALKSSLAVSAKKPERVTGKAKNSVKNPDRDYRSSAPTATAVEFPKFLAELITPPIKVRGSMSDRQTINLIAPIAEVLRTSQPVFRWERAESPTIYRVKIFDVKFNEIASSPPLEKAEWQPLNPLPQGRVLLWQVKIENSDGQKTKLFAQAKFYILPKKNLRTIKTIEKNSASPLDRAVAFAEAGLLDEAKAILTELLEQRPRSRKIRNLLEEISAVKNRNHR